VRFGQEGAVVGDRELIDAEIADFLVGRLHAAGQELHRALALPVSADVENRIESAIDHLDAAINLIRLAALGFEPPGESA
jgi:hypothetical protein